MNGMTGHDRFDRHDKIDKLIQLAFLEQVIGTHGAYEHAVAERAFVPEFSPSGDLIERLAVALQKSKRVQTVGGYLKKIRHLQSLAPQDIFSRLGVSRNVYAMIEEDRISPLKVSLAAWQRLASLFSIPLVDLAEMIRKTHQIVYFRPAFRTTLARYHSGKKGRKKSATLEKAATEMFLKAELEVSEEERLRLSEFIRALTEGE
jgi:transcriptional regulator with XRE-family HTH domain